MGGSQGCSGWCRIVGQVGRIHNVVSRCCGPVSFSAAFLGDTQILFVGFKLRNRWWHTCGWGFTVMEITNANGVDLPLSKIFSGLPATT